MSRRRHDEMTVQERRSRSRSRSRQKFGKRMHENCVALSMRISYHPIMTFWNTAKRGEYMQPCSRRELALSTRTVAILGH
jgi:hypothetical protein